MDRVDGSTARISGRDLTPGADARFTAPLDEQLSNLVH